MYLGETMKNPFAALINLVTLVVGIAIGLLLAPRMEHIVAAQQTQPSACMDSATVECITPIMTVGSAGIGKLVTNQISSDQLTVNGYDILKLQNNMLSAMVQHGILLPAQAQTIAEQSHPDKYLHYQPRPQPSVAVPVKP